MNSNFGKAIVITGVVSAACSWLILPFFRHALGEWVWTAVGIAGMLAYFYLVRSILRSWWYKPGTERSGLEAVALFVGVTAAPPLLALLVQAAV